ILATPSGARPKWLADQYPEVLRMTEDRRRNLFGERHNHCYTSMVYRDKVKAIDTELAKRFGNHPAVILWHISNELGGSCFCPQCQKKFQEWLKNKYKTIDELNEQWDTAFWSHRYQRFEQVEAPSSLGERGLHGLVLDWKRFVTAQTVDFMNTEIQALRDAGSSKPVTTNMMYEYKGLDYPKLADSLDVISWDTYPVWHKGKEAKIAEDTAMQHDYFRSMIPGRPFLLMESSPSATNWQAVSKLRRPGMVKLAALHTIAHGSDASLFFQMRQARGSMEKFHGAVIDHYGGSDTRVFEEVTETGKALDALSEVAGSVTRSQAAIICDTENYWAAKEAKGPRNQGLYQKETQMKCYHGMRRMGMDVDIISMDADISSYKLVAAPMAYMFREGFAERITEFVRLGGTFLLTYWSGVVNANDLCYLGGRPYGLTEVMGFLSTEIDGLYDGEENGIIPCDGNTLGLKRNYRCNHLCELTKPLSHQSGFEVLGSYETDFYAGLPAVTCNTYGKGKAYALLADAEEAFYEDFFEALLQLPESGLHTPIETPLPPEIEISCREKGDTQYLFIQNFGETTSFPLLRKEWNEDSEILYRDGSGDRLEKWETVVRKRV
ncbi:MAG: beta-galactosidase, partial [Hungatella sp.]